MQSIYINMFAGGSQREREAVSHFGSGKLLLDARAGTIDIPGDGTEKLTFTSAQDIGKFVAASLDLDEWEDVSGIVGESTTSGDAFWTSKTRIPATQQTIFF